MLTTVLRLPMTTLARLFAVLAVVGSLLGGVAMAQQTVGVLTGTVTDPEGLEIPDVEVTLRSPALIGGAQTRRTNEQGRYEFIELFPGLYELTLVHPGFAGKTITGIQININRTTTQNVVLDPGQVTEITVENSEGPVIDVESTAIGTTLTRDLLQKLPVGRDYLEAINLAAGVQGTGNANIAGAGTRENTYLLDGAVVTDPVTGTFATNFNFDAIQQLEVLLGGFDAEYGVSLGGIVNIVTETGTNNLEFDTSVFYTNGQWSPKVDERLTADGFYLASTGFDQQFQEIQVSARVSGPLVKDKAWFIFSYQWARTLIALAGIPQARDFSGHYLLAKLSAQPNTSHRLTLQAQIQPTTIDNIVQNSQFIRPEAQSRQYQTGVIAQARWQWFFNSDMNLDTRFVLQKTAIEQSSVPCTHNVESDSHKCLPNEEEGSIDYETPGRIGVGGAFDSVSAGQFYFDNRWRFSGAIKYSWVGKEDPLGGVHDVKAGVETNQLLWDQVQGLSGNLLFADVNRNGFDPQTFTNYFWQESSGALLQRSTGATWSAFIQDVYKPIPRVTIRYGLRYDNSVLRNNEGTPVVNGQGLSPRVFAAWDPLGDQKTKIAGGWGRFTDSSRQEIAAQLSTASFGTKLFLGEFFDQGNAAFGYTNGAANLYTVAPRQNLTTANDVLNLPYSDEFSFQVQRQVVTDVAITGRFQGRFTRSLFTFDELNFIYDEDGSGIIGGRRGDPFNNYLRLRTPREAQRNYYRFDVELIKRQSKRWAGQITYSYTWQDGNMNEQLAGTFSNDPQTQYNFGQLVNAPLHSVNGLVFWDIPNDPWTSTLGAVVQYDSGVPLERFYWSDALPRSPESNAANGDYSLRIRDRQSYWEFNPIWELGIRYIQKFNVRRGQLALDLQVLNVLNNQAPAQISGLLFSQNRLFSVRRQDPLRFQLGVRYTY